jgi:hypothetical protein
LGAAVLLGVLTAVVAAIPALLAIPETRHRPPRSAARARQPALARPVDEYSIAPQNARASIAATTAPAELAPQPVPPEWPPASQVGETAPAAPRPPDLSTRPAPAARAHEWNRSAEARQRGLNTFGGTPQTESAVEAGLAWLAAHQSRAGTWDRLHFDRRCPPDDRCPGPAIRREDQELTAGLSGLALLAFLGAGYTGREGPYTNVVDAGVDALVRLQEPHGGFSQSDGMAGYNDALATLALGEYFALTHDNLVRSPLENAVGRLVADQQQLGGWDYSRAPGSGRNDTSISAWVVQALHACAAAGIEVPRETLVRAALHFSGATERDGRVRYADAEPGVSLDDRLRPVFRYGPGMLAAGLTCEQLLGWRLDAPTPLRQRALVLADLPSAGKARGRDATGLHNEYYWYYGTLAMFQRGRTDWEEWNARLRDAILPLQERATVAGGRHKHHTYGSWPAYGANWGVFGRMGGRIYTTAICTLTLEIYYRHTPAFLAGDVLFSADDWRAHLEHLPLRDRVSAIACLGQLRLEIGEPALVELLADEDERVAVPAAEALAWLDSPAGLPVIDKAITEAPLWQQQALQSARDRAQAVRALPPVEGRVRLFDPKTARATLDLPRSYVGMAVRVQRADEEIARLRVIQRFTDRTVVVAERVEPAGAASPKTGDRAVGQ